METFYAVLLFLPLIGGLFCTITSSIASTCVMSFFGKIDWYDFVKDHATDNFTTLSFAASAHAYSTLIVHGVMLFIFFRCSRFENFQRVLYSLLLFLVLTSCSVLAIIAAMNISGVLPQLSEGSDNIGVLKSMRGGLGALAAFSILGAVFYFGMLVGSFVYMAMKNQQDSYEKI